MNWVSVQLMLGAATLLGSELRTQEASAGILEQSMGARVIVPARKSTQAGGIDSLESIPELLKSLKIRALGSAKLCLV